MEQPDFVFNSHPTRFSYYHITHDIGIPCNVKYNELDELPNTRYTTLLHWITVCLNHEYLHKLLHEFISFDAMRYLDNLSYGDMVCGFINAEQILGKKDLLKSK